MYRDPDWTDDGRSFVNTVYGVGPSTNPWGLPMDIKSMSDFVKFCLAPLMGPLQLGSRDHNFLKIFYIMGYNL